MAHLSDGRPSDAKKRTRKPDHRDSATMPGGNDYGEPKTAQHRHRAQTVLNESWPLTDTSCV